MAVCVFTANKPQNVTNITVRGQTAHLATILIDLKLIIIKVSLQNKKYIYKFNKHLLCITEPASYLHLLNILCRTSLHKTAGYVFCSQRLRLSACGGGQQCGGPAAPQPLSQRLRVLQRPGGSHADLADSCVDRNPSGSREQEPAGCWLTPVSKHRQSNLQPDLSDHIPPSGPRSIISFLWTASRGTSLWLWCHSAQSWAALGFCLGLLR